MNQPCSGKKSLSQQIILCGDDDDVFLACENMGFVATHQPLMNKSKLRIAISYRSKTYPITLEDISTVSAFQDLIFDTIGVRSENQKILVPPKARQLLQTLRAGTATQTTIRDVGLSDCMQITVIGAPDDEIKEVQAEEEKWGQTFPHQNTFPIIEHDEGVA